jgi:hypothetical protein
MSGNERFSAPTVNRDRQPFGSWRIAFKFGKWPDETG